jgi:hypothetical protein
MPNSQFIRLNQSLGQAKVAALIPAAIDINLRDRIGGVGSGRGGLGELPHLTPPPVSAPPVPVTPPAPVPPANTPATRLQVLLASIPRAEDGHIITAEYHNALRSALLAIADQFNIGLADLSFARTFAPAFLPIETIPYWTLRSGIAYLSLEDADAEALRFKAKRSAEDAARATTSANTFCQDSLTVAATIRSDFLKNSLQAAVDGTRAAREKAATAFATIDEPASATNLTAASASATVAAAAIQKALTTIRSQREVDLFEPPTVRTLDAAAKTLNNAVIQTRLALDSLRLALDALAALAVGQRPDRPSSCRGWLPLQLPDGAGIQGFIVAGSKVGAAVQFDISLVRQNITDSSELVLATRSLTSADESFSEATPISTGVSPTDAVVDNSRFKYLLTAEAAIGAGARVQINAVQVACSQ